MTQLVHLYRIDKRESPYWGPFIYARQNLSILAKQLKCTDPSDMTSVQDDIRNFVSDHHVCAFDDLRDLVSAFDAIMRRWLHDDGFVLSVYKVPFDDILRGNHQCAFSPKGLFRRIFHLA